MLYFNSTLKMIVFSVVLSTHAFADTDAPAESSSGDWLGGIQPIGQRAAVTDPTSVIDQATSYTNQAIKWTQEDLQNLGKWLYKVKTIDTEDADKIEALLAEAGNEKWELVFVTEHETKLTFIFKKPAVSYLAKYGQTAIKALPVPKIFK